MIPLSPYRRVVSSLPLLLIVAFCLPSGAVQALAQEQAVTPEKNPPGDIPDTQAFVTYTSPVGYSFKTPEGWARRDGAGGVSFADKYGLIEAEVVDMATAPTAASVKAGLAVQMEKTVRAIRISKIRDVSLPGGPAVLIVYTSNSEPNAVTNTQIRLENNRYVIGHSGKALVLTFSAPAGADNVDQWKLMSDSVRWN